MSSKQKDTRRLSPDKSINPFGVFGSRDPRGKNQEIIVLEFGRTHIPPAVIEEIALENSRRLGAETIMKIQPMLIVGDINDDEIRIQTGSPDNPTFHGVVFAVYERNPDGSIKRDTKGQPIIATAPGGRKKRACLLLEFQESCYEYNEQTYSAFVGGGGSVAVGACPHGHTSADDDGGINGNDFVAGEES